jgi:hypothetical protein
LRLFYTKTVFFFHPLAMLSSRVAVLLVLVCLAVSAHAGSFRAGASKINGELAFSLRTVFTSACAHELVTSSRSLLSSIPVVATLPLGTPLA